MQIFKDGKNMIKAQPNALQMWAWDNRPGSGNIWGKENEMLNRKIWEEQQRNLRAGIVPNQPSLTEQMLGSVNNQAMGTVQAELNKQTPLDPGLVRMLIMHEGDNIAEAEAKRKKQLFLQQQVENLPSIAEVI